MKNSGNTMNTQALSAPNRARTVLCLVFFLSGAFGLVYEVLWMRMLGLVFGNTTYAISIVTAAFMGGLSAGSWYFGRYAASSKDPLKLYASLELGLGFYALLTPLIFGLMESGYIFLCGLPGVSVPAANLIRFFFSFAVLFVPTALMGGTLPALMAQLSGSNRDNAGDSASLLYGINTLGAVFGAFAAAFLLISVLGVKTSLYFISAANIALACYVYYISVASKAVEPVQSIAQEEVPLSGSVRERRLLLLAVGFAGFISLACEVIWTRLLASVIGPSVYAFAITLCAFLAGIAVGSLIFKALRSRKPELFNVDPLLIVGLIMGATGALVLFTIPLFSRLPLLSLYLFNTLGIGFAGIQSAHAFIAFLLLAAPALLFGFLLPCTVSLYRGDDKAAVRLGNIYAANTAGAVLGALISGFVFITFIGLQGTIQLAGLSAAALSIILILAGTRAAKTVRWTAAGFIVMASAPYVFAVNQWDRAMLNSGVYQYAGDIIEQAKEGGMSVGAAFRELLAGREMLYYREGTNFSVAVSRDLRTGIRSLAIDGKVDASDNFRSDMQTQMLSGHLPMLLHSGAKKVLVIGLASGVTLGAVGAYPVEEMDCVEIEPAMIEAAGYFADRNGNILKDERVRLIKNDARNHLLSSGKKYDLIISVPSNPWLAGSSPLFTKEFFELAKSRLNKGGVFCQWMQIYEVRMDEFRSAVKTVSGVFPEVTVWNTVGGDMLFVAAEEAFSVDYKVFADRFKTVAGALAPLGIKTPLDILSRFLMAGGNAAEFAKNAPVNSDEHPFIEFSAPKYTYRRDLAENNFLGLLAGADTISTYLKGFTAHGDLAGIYLQKGMFLAAESEISGSSAGLSDKYNMLGELYLKQGRNSEAVAQFEKAAAANPGYRKAFINLSRIYLDGKDQQKAMEYAQKAGSGPEAYNQTGLIYLSRGDTRQAANYFSKARKADAKYIPAYVNEAVVYLDYLDVPPAALELMDSAKKINGNMPELYYHSGRALYKMGFAREALTDFNRAVSIEPAYVGYIREAVKKINGSRG